MTSLKEAEDLEMKLYIKGVIDRFVEKFLEDEKPCPPEYTQVLIDNVEDILA